MPCMDVAICVIMVSMMWLWIVATVVAFYIKGLCGFANTLVFDSILGFGASNVEIAPVELILSYPANIVLTWQNRDKLKKHIFVPIMLMVLGGSVVGAFLLKSLDVKLLKMIFGIVVTLVGADMLRKEYARTSKQSPRWVLAIMGIASGLLCGLFGVGVLVAAYVSEITETASEFKANLSIVFIAENTVRIITYVALGVITFTTIKHVLILIPFMLLGLFAGMLSAKVLDEKLVKKLVIVLLIISGVVLFIKNM